MKPWRQKTHWLQAALTLVLVGGMIGSAWACPTCKDNLADQDVQGDYASGFFWSVLFMVTVPYLVLGGIGAYMYLLVRKARQAAAAASPQVTSTDPANTTTSSARLVEEMAEVSRDVETELEAVEVQAARRSSAPRFSSARPRTMATARIVCANPW